jgi:5-methylthioadenosine/S-adenosylhomocysteine deaminase
LSLLEELRFVRQRGLLADAAALLRCATLDAARGLGLEARIGSLEPGKAADLAAFPVPRATRDPVAHVIEAAPAAARVWVAGRELRDPA